MEGSDGSPPQSLCVIRDAEEELSVPIQKLAGEEIQHYGSTADGVLALSNYRIFLFKNSNNSETSVPLGLIETLQARDLLHLIINCKDASTVKCSFETADKCYEWHRLLQQRIGIPERLEKLFAFPFYTAASEDIARGVIAQNGGAGSAFNFNAMENIVPIFAPCSVPDYSERLQPVKMCNEDDFNREVGRLGFDMNGSWRKSNVNKEFRLCPSYPQDIIVPSCINDEMLQGVADFRGSRRLPAVVWRHMRTGAVIARCSQPEVGWLGWRNAKDEQLLKALADACAFDLGEQTRNGRAEAAAASSQAMGSDKSSSTSLDSSHEEVQLDEVKKILIVDARSYTSAVTNRARGGGVECTDYYPFADIEFMNLGNIHVIRKSFHALRQLYASPPDSANWLSTLERTMWLQHLSGLLTATLKVCHTIERQGRPVLVHCSDGWDRTPQIVATAELCLDPHYRTVEGFRVLVEREWLSFGHKFADRCGHGPNSEELNERCPVFIQWLDLVHQIHKQFPCSFEFSMAYLIKLAQHSHSCLFGTFLCNTYKERLDNGVFDRTFSVWPFLSGPMYRNPLYVPNREKVLWPAINVRDLHVWTEVYLGSLGNQNSVESPSANADDSMNEADDGSMSPMAKTRSYNDLISGTTQNGISRRSSDPNMTVEPSHTIDSNSKSTTTTDTPMEREDSPDTVADTTRKLRNLTDELNNHDKELFENPPTPPEARSDSEEKAEQPIEKSNEKKKKLQLKIQLQRDVEPLLSFAKLTIESEATRTSPNRRTEFELPTSSANIFASNISTNVVFNSKGEESVVETTTEMNRVSVRTSNDVHINLLQGLDLNDSLDSSDEQQNTWHGSVNTSTDTLVPIESKQRSNEASVDVRDGACESVAKTRTFEFTKDNSKSKSSNNQNNSSNSTNSNILPKVHSSSSNSSRSNNLSASSSNTSVSSVASSSNNTTQPSSSNKSATVQQNSSNKANASGSAISTSSSSSNSSSCDNKTETPSSQQTIAPQQPSPATVDPMEESILILPAHKKLDISNSGNYETTTSLTAAVAGAIGQTATPSSFSCASTSHGASMQGRRRTSSSNSQRDACNTKNVNGSTPMTPPGLPERPQVAISCPDGLAHALSEINIRLQQIVHEHKMREDRLLREIHNMRIALLKKCCPNCHNTPATNNDEQVDEVISNECKLFDLQNLRRRRHCQGHRQQRRRRRQRRRQQQQYRSNIKSFSCTEADSDSYDDDTCDCNCNDAHSSLSACSALDNVEDASICSWEEVEDRSGPSSSASSSIQPNITSVRWVPDHAVSRCTRCQVEFWLGRRKHHCRSCGQIFCADCSEYYAPLPDEKLFSPVRLCESCYQTVTARVQLQQHTRTNLINNINMTTMTTTTSAITTNSNNRTAIDNDFNALLTKSAPSLQQQLTLRPNNAMETTVDNSATNKIIVDNSNMPHMMLSNNIAASVAN